MGGRGLTIVSGPMACGKTRNSAALQERFGCHTVIDDYTLYRGRDGRPLPRNLDGCLLLTYEPVDALKRRFPNANVVRYHDVMATPRPEAN